MASTSIRQGHTFHVTLTAGDYTFSVDGLCTNHLAVQGNSTQQVSLHCASGTDGADPANWATSRPSARRGRIGLTEIGSTVVLGALAHHRTMQGLKQVTTVSTAVTTVPTVCNPTSFSSASVLEKISTIV